MIWWVLEVEVEFKGEEEEEQVVLSVLQVEVEFKGEDEEDQVIWWVLEVEVEFKEEGGGVTCDLVCVGGRGGVQGGGGGGGTGDLGSWRSR